MAKETAGNTRARITVKVQPRAKVTRVLGRMESAGRPETTYRLQIAAPPVDGKANEACIAFVAALAGVPKSRVCIVSGLTSRMKVIEIDGIAQDEMERRLIS